MKRSFRVGLRLGLLAGLAAAAVMALRAKRTKSDEPGMATGVHGDWPPVVRHPTPEPARPTEHTGDHHPVGRVVVPPEAAPPGAPPSLATDEPGMTEPDLPPPAEHLDEESATTGAEAEPAEAAGGPAPAAPAAPAAPVAAKAAAARKAAVRKAAAPKKVPEPSRVAPGPRPPAGEKASDTGGAPDAGGREAWVAPQGTVCPVSHPVKAKLSSRLFHLPGMLAYDRTVPDRCYVDGAAAEADGLTRAKR